MKSYYKATVMLISSLFVICSAHGAEKKITINKESYSEVYPAVWFNPDKGTIHTLTAKSEKPPVEGATIWIEPDDPEFAIGPNVKGVSFYEAGAGEDSFKNIAWTEGLRKVSEIDMSVLKGDASPVYIIQTEKGRYAIILDAVDTDKSSIVFRWKPLN